MKVAYVDTSCLVAITFGEPGGTALSRKLHGFDEIVSSNLLEAELRASLVREGVEYSGESFAAISWILPDRPLHDEITRVLAAGYVRGADCWHLSTALYLTADPSEIYFLTLDQRQKKVARKLGFLE